MPDKSAQLLEGLAWVQDHDDLCRALVHSDFFGAQFHAAAIAIIHQDARAHEIAQYGLIGDRRPFTNLSIFSTSPLSQAIVNGRPVLLHDPHLNPVHFDNDYDWSNAKVFPTVYLVPMVHQRVPFAILAMLSNEKIEQVSLSPQQLSILTSILTLVLRSSYRVGGTGLLTPRVGSQLTQRQEQVLDLLRQGLSNREIASALNVSVATTKLDVQRILKSYRVKSRKDLPASDAVGIETSS